MHLCTWHQSLDENARNEYETFGELYLRRFYYKIFYFVDHLSAQIPEIFGQFLEIL